MRASNWRTQGTIWTDGSFFDNGRVGAACAWQISEGWTGRRFHLGSNKKVFDAEIFASYQVLSVFEPRRQSGRKYNVFSDSQAAIRRSMSDSLKPDQQWARAIVEVAGRIIVDSNEILVCWVPAHRGVKGNEVADGMANEAAVSASHSVPDQIRRQASLPHLARRASEHWSEATSR